MELSGNGKSYATGTRRDDNLAPLQPRHLQPRRGCDDKRIVPELPAWQRKPNPGPVQHIGVRCVLAGKRRPIGGHGRMRAMRAGQVSAR